MAISVIKSHLTIMKKKENPLSIVDTVILCTCEKRKFKFNMLNHRLDFGTSPWKLHMFIFWLHF